MFTNWQISGKPYQRKQVQQADSTQYLWPLTWYLLHKYLESEAKLSSECGECGLWNWSKVSKGVVSGRLANLQLVLTSWFDPKFCPQSAYILRFLWYSQQQCQKKRQNMQFSAFLQQQGSVIRFYVCHTCTTDERGLRIDGRTEDWRLRILGLKTEDWGQPHYFWDPLCTFWGLKNLQKSKKKKKNPH